jgi:ABC-2 type transport system permease protein
MTRFAPALYAELLKARRARAPWLIAISLMLAPTVAGLFMFILKNPEQARAWGLIGTKAQLAGTTADWPAFFALLAQAVAVGGAFVFGMMTAWIFGREFADHTAKELLALPTPRASIVAAKFVVLLGWSAVVTGLVLLVGVVVGHIVSLPRWSLVAVMTGARTTAFAAALTVALMPVVAFVASIGRGYLAPLGWTALAIFLAQISAALGQGPYFPWSIPALASGLAGTDAARLGAVSYGLVALVSLAGFLATLRWWQKADFTE